MARIKRTSRKRQACTPPKPGCEERKDKVFQRLNIGLFPTWTKTDDLGERPLHGLHPFLPRSLHLLIGHLIFWRQKLSNPCHG